MSAMRSGAPASASCMASGDPTLPAPWMTTVRPSRLSDPNAHERLSRMPWKTPVAVGGARLPDTPATPRDDARPRGRRRAAGTAGFDRATEHVLRSFADDVHVLLAGVHVGARS